MRCLSRFPLLQTYGVIAERFGFTNHDVLSRSPFFLKGVKGLVLPADYEPLNESARLSAATRRRIT